MALTFDSTYYYKNRPDVLEAFLNSDFSVSPYQFALNHYNTYGWKEDDTNPNAVFNTAEYLAANEDVAEAGVNPFEHYINHGLSEGRAPNASIPARADFNWDVYLASNPDLGEAGITNEAAAYTHFVTYGYAEDRPGTPEALSFTLAEAIAAGDDLPEGYVLTDTDLTGAQTLAEVAAAAAIVAGAHNAEADELELGGDFTVADSAENILAAEELPVDVSLISFTDDTITAEQRDALVELGFDAETLPPLNADDALIEALANLQAAQEAKADFLDEVEMSEAQVNQALIDAETELAQHVVDEGTQAQIDAAVVTAQADLDAAQGNLNAALAADAELAEMVADLEAGQAAYQAFVVAGNSTVASMQAIVTAYNGDPDTVDQIIPTVSTVEAVAGLATGATVFTLGGIPAIVLNVDGDLVFAPGIAAADRADLADVLEAAQAVYDASQEWLVAKADYSEDVLAALNFGVTPPTITDADSTYVNWMTGELQPAFYAGVPAGVPSALMQAVENAQDALIQAQAIVTERAELISAISEAQDLVDQLAALNETIDEAQAIVDELGDVVTVTGAVAATDDAEIFMYAGVQASDESIIDFSSDDVLFIGEGYAAPTLLAADADLDAATVNYGDVAALDIFIQQNGDDAVVYIENRTFDGQNGSGFGGDSVTLVGVDASNITFDNGILRVSEPVIA